MNNTDLADFPKTLTIELKAQKPTISFSLLLLQVFSELKHFPSLIIPPFFLHLALTFPSFLPPSFPPPFFFFLPPPVRSLLFPPFLPPTFLPPFPPSFLPPFLPPFPPPFFSFRLLPSSLLPFPYLSSFLSSFLRFSLSLLLPFLFLSPSFPPSFPFPFSFLAFVLFLPPSLPSTHI